MLGLSHDDLKDLDARAAQLGRGAAALRLALGEVLEAMARSAAHHELGFPSVEAYARERCERAPRWASESRTLARQLSQLPRLRASLVGGQLGWSMAVLVARHATGETECNLLELARRSTVRQMREVLHDEPPQDQCAESWRTLTLTLDEEQHWLLECTRMLVSRISGLTMQDDIVHALLAEGWSTLPELTREIRIEDDLDDIARKLAWRAQLACWRSLAEARCESRWHPLVQSPEPAREVCSSRALAGLGPTELDARARELSAELARRDIELGELFDALCRADGWRRLGFASAAQYARERIGVSLSSLKQRRSLARRLGALRKLRQALLSGRVGYEATRLVSRVATPETETAWVERARRRTVKHLQEECERSELEARRHGGPPTPPTGERMQQLDELERYVRTGQLYRDGVLHALLGEALARKWLPAPKLRVHAPGQTAAGTAGQMSAGAASSEPAATAGQMSAGAASGETAGTAGQMSAGAAASPETADFAWIVERLLGVAPQRRRRRAEAPAGSERGLGRVTVRLRVRQETYRFWRTFEHSYQRWGGGPKSFVEYLCTAMWAAWYPMVEQTRAWDQIHARDRDRCTSPVCTRCGVTAHHLRFRSRGGGDEDENLTSLCPWCHLEGVHGGRIRVTPPASQMRWTLGRSGLVQVHGRERLAA